MSARSEREHNLSATQSAWRVIGCPSLPVAISTHRVTDRYLALLERRYASALAPLAALATLEHSLAALAERYGSSQ